jgi:uncharacterized protein YdeI (YjbR/CyaY-like superfamily)
LTDLAQLPFESAEAWEDWLRDHHSDAPGVWVQFAKKASGLPTVSFGEALDGALCYGWIDGQSRSLDDTWYLQKFTPRARRSTWSKRNREKVAQLIAAGRMQPAGQAEIDRAKADGHWDAAYDSPSTATVPNDLKRALEKSPKADELFKTLDSQNRYAILHRIQGAKKPETRARRIEQLVAMLAAGKTLYPMSNRRS